MPTSKDVLINSDRSPESGISEAAIGAFEFDVAHVASLVADGTVAWPDDLTDTQAANLTVAIRNINRSRLIKLLARLIAADIVRRETPEIES